MESFADTGLNREFLAARTKDHYAAVAKKLIAWGKSVDAMFDGAADLSGELEHAQNTADAARGQLRELQDAISAVEHRAITAEQAATTLRRDLADARRQVAEFERYQLEQADLMGRMLNLADDAKILATMIRRAPRPESSAA